MALVFWVSCAIVAYVYAGYPALLRLWARIRPRPLAVEANTDRATAGSDPASLPGVSIIIAARNEAERLPARIANLLSLEYPASKRQIIVVSDGSTDGTERALVEYADVVEVVAVAPGGKALALNAGVARATNEILVFADARQVFAPDALLELTAPFADPSVGGVTGELLLDCESPRADDRRQADRRRRDRRQQVRDEATDRRTIDRRRGVASTIADGVGLYWRYEKALRRLESEVNSTLGATGAIYALRRSLWQPLPADTILDDVLAPMRAVLARYRIVFNERARAFDRAAVDADAEARRKVRTLAGNYQILWLEPRLVLPWRNPVWVQYVSHKLGRLVVPYALLVIFVANIALAMRGRVYQLTMAGQLGFYLLAAYGAWLDATGRLDQPAAAAGAVGAPERKVIAGAEEAA